ncbi:MAG: hypothetical protein WDO06_09120 [Actinomycetota bacterium]
MPIQHLAINDELLHAFSKEVRRLNIEMREWLDVSSDWDEVLANLRRADWRLRNQPADFGENLPAKVYLAAGLSRLDGLFANLGHEIRAICRSILANGNAILQRSESSLNSNLVRLIKESETGGANNLLVIVRQEDLIEPCIELLRKELISNVTVDTGYSALQKKHQTDKLIVVGNSLDYSPSIFTSLSFRFGTTLVGYSWVPEQDSIETALSLLANRRIAINVVHSISKNKSEAIDVSHFLEPSVEIASRQLKNRCKERVRPN